jgi:PAS domain S-box-containing protein
MSNDESTRRRRRRLALAAGAGLVALAASPAGPKLLSQGGFLPHGVCLAWAPSLLTLYLVADLLIAAAYLSIPVTIAYLVRRRGDLPFNWIFLLFAAFLVASGLTHLIEVGTLWYPYYWLAGAVKAVTALVSVAAAIALIWLMPGLLALPSRAQLEEAHGRMQAEMDQRRAAELRLRAAHAALEAKVTERTAELATVNSQLTRQREWLQVILTSIADGVLAADAQGRVVFLNAVAERLTGWHDADAHGKPLDQLWQVRDAVTGQPRASLVARVLSTRTIQRLPAARVRVGSDPTERVLEETGVPLGGNGEGLRGIVLFVRDLTPIEASEATRAQLQSNLAATNALLDTLFEAAPVGFGFWDLQRRFVKVNPALAALVGLPVEAHPGKTPFEILPGLGAQVNALLQQVIDEARAVRDVEVSGEVPGNPGARRWWRSSFYPVSAGEKLIGVGGICAEITREKQAEDERSRLLAGEREARHEAERVSLLKDEFLATVSHELRNPLNSIVGWAHMLESGRLSEEDQRKAIATIARNAKAQARLVKDLLDFSRLGSGRLRLDIRQVDPARAITAACEMFQPAVQAKSLELHCEMEKAGILVAADPDRLQQIVSNLLSNAIKFTEAPGRIDVSLRRAGSTVEIAVSDTGAGIAPEFLPHVFDPFRQADGGSARQHQGLGLGLAIVRSLAELQGGTVSAASAGPGKGAQFVVRLPIAAFVAEDSDAERAVRARDSLRGLAVLIVDESADVRSALHDALREYGAEVLLADSATGALAALESTRVDVLVSDVGLVDADGVALITRLRAAPRHHNLPAIALTAQGRSEERAAALAAGFQRHLTRPARLDALVNAIAELAHGS